MRRLLFILLLASIPAGATIAQNVGCNNRGSGVTSVACTMSPTAGNRVICFYNASGAGPLSTIAIKDNNNNSLSAGPVLSGSGGLVNHASFQGLAVSGATAYTATWTGSGTASIACEDYSGSLSINTGLSGNTATNTGTSATITVTTEDNNDWVVCGLADTTNTLTVTVGNQRQNWSTTGNKQVLLDNTSASPGNVTCTATLTSANWTAIALELRTVSGASGKCASCDLSWIGEWGWGEEWAVGE